MPRADRRVRPTRKVFPWGLTVISGVALLIGLGFAAAQLSLRAPQPTSSAGLPVGAAAPAVALPATTGGSFSLDRYRGAKAVIYFYEGAG